MIKIANNLTVLCQTRHKQSFTVPTQEQQMLAALDPVGFNENSNHQFTNMLQGGLLGGGVGALAGLPFGGVGAIPGAGLGALTGILAGGIIPELMSKGKTKITPAEEEIISANIASKNRRRRAIALGGTMIGGGLGAVAGVPFGGVGAVPGILGGALAGNISGKLLSGFTKDNIAETFNKNNPVYQQLIAKLQKAQKEGQ